MFFLKIKIEYFKNRSMNIRHLFNVCSFKINVKIIRNITFIEISLRYCCKFYVFFNKNK